MDTFSQTPLHFVGTMRVRRERSSSQSSNYLYISQFITILRIANRRPPAGHADLDRSFATSVFAVREKPIRFNENRWASLIADVIVIVERNGAAIFQGYSFRAMRKEEPKNRCVSRSAKHR